MRNYKLAALALVAICLMVFEREARAQSTDQSNPTPIAANELVITGPKKSNQQYYYSFTGGPGEVSLQFNVKAKSSSTFVGVKVFDAELNTLAYHNMSADTSPSMALKKFDVGGKQTLMLSFTSDPSLGECKLTFGGAVEFAGADTGGGTNASATLSETNPKLSNSQPDVMTSSGEQNSTASSGGSMGKNKSFVFSILDAVGQRFNIPATGKLHIEMKDGSVQDIDLTQVKKLQVKQ